MVTILLFSLFRGKRPDVYIVSSPNFFSVISTYIMSRMRRVPYIFEVRDLWPGIFIELSVLKNRFLIRLLEMIELFLYRQAAAVVPVTQGFAEDMMRRGIPANKVNVITNGADLDFFHLDLGNDDLRAEIGISKDKFIILYMGAHGISHGLPKILDAANSLREEKDIHFLFVGEGAIKSNLINLAMEKHLQNVTFLPGQPREKVVGFYHLSDVCLVPLRNISGLDTFIPSKMFEIMGCGRPIIAPLRGEAADILLKSGAALVIPPENPEELVKAIHILRSSPETCNRMGQNGHNFVEKNFDRKLLARNYLALLEKVVNNEN
jgi:glycosyltransferase involved in cell wall biosynthesis